MRVYEISGYDKHTDEHLIAQVAAPNYNAAMRMMGMTHRKLVCTRKAGAEIEFKRRK